MRLQVYCAASTHLLVYTCFRVHKILKLQTHPTSHPNTSASVCESFTKFHRCPTYLHVYTCVYFRKRVWINWCVRTYGLFHQQVFVPVHLITCKRVLYLPHEHLPERVCVHMWLLCTHTDQRLVPCPGSLLCMCVSVCVCLRLSTWPDFSTVHIPIFRHTHTSACAQLCRCIHAPAQVCLLTCPPMCLCAHT